MIKRFFVYILLLTTSISTTLGFDLKTGNIDLPTVLPLKIEKILYSYKPEPPVFLGDGYYAYIVNPGKKDMDTFLKNLTDLKNRSDWIHGSLELYRLNRKVLDQIRKAVEDTIGKGELEKVDQILNYDELIKNTNLYHKIVYDETKGVAEIWIIIPDKNTICYFCHNH